MSSVRDDEDAESEPDRDGGGEVAAGAALLLLEDLLGGDPRELVERRVVRDGLERPAPPSSACAAGVGSTGSDGESVVIIGSSIEVTPRAARPPWP